jgi:hypothetical protein
MVEVPAPTTVTILPLMIATDEEPLVKVNVPELFDVGESAKGEAP